MHFLSTCIKALLLLAIVQGLFFAALLYLKARGREGRVLVQLLLAFTLDLALELVQFLGPTLAWLMPLSVTVLLVLGPLALTYFEAVIRPEQPSLSSGLYRHWIFSATAGFCTLATLLPWYSSWSAIPHGHIEISSILLLLSGFLLLVAALVQQGLCLWSARRQLAEAKKGAAADSHRNARLAWLDLLLRVLTVLWIGAVTATCGGLLLGDNQIISELGNLFYAIAIYCLGGFALLNPDSLLPPREAIEAVLAKYRKSALTAADVNRLVAKVEQEMLRTQAWRDSSLSLTVLSRRIGASTNDVSQAINQGTGGGFYEYVNRYRVDDAKNQLHDPAQASKTILDIAYQVGFNSKSAFNTAFRKLTGTTPTSFRTGRTSSPTGPNDAPPLQTAD